MFCQLGNCNCNIKYFSVIHISVMINQWSNFDLIFTFYYLWWLVVLHTANFHDPLLLLLSIRINIQYPFIEFIKYPIRFNLITGTSSEAPTQRVLVNGTAQMKCDIATSMTIDKALLVVWYKNNLPIYRWVCYSCDFYAFKMFMSDEK